MDVTWKWRLLVSLFFGLFILLFSFAYYKLMEVNEPEIPLVQNVLLRLIIIFSIGIAMILIDGFHIFDRIMSKKANYFELEDLIHQNDGFCIFQANRIEVKYYKLIFRSNIIAFWTFTGTIIFLLGGIIYAFLPLFGTAELKISSTNSISVIRIIEIALSMLIISFFLIAGIKYRKMNPVTIIDPINKIIKYEVTHSKSKMPQKRFIATFPIQALEFSIISKLLPVTQNNVPNHSMIKLPINMMSGEPEIIKLIDDKNTDGFFPIMINSNEDWVIKVHSLIFDFVNKYGKAIIRPETQVLKN